MRKQSEITAYRHVKDNQGIDCTTKAVINRIQSGAKGLRTKIEELRRLFQTDRKAYDTEKVKLPAVTWSGTFDKRNAHRLRQHSGLIVIDFDDVEDGASLKADLAQDATVLFAFNSPSGVSGVKAVARVEPIPKDASEHKIAFAAAKAHFEQYAEVDENGSDVSRMCFLSYDPRAIYYPDAIPITWDPEDQEVFESEQIPTTHFEDTGWHADIDTDALQYIQPDNYHTWIRVGFAIKSEGLDFSVWDAWSQTGEKYNPDEMRYKWDSFGSQYHGKRVTWATVIHFAQQGGYEPPRTYRRAKPKMTLNPDARTWAPRTPARDVEAILAQHANAIFESEASVHIVIGETGTGKTYQYLTTSEQLGKTILQISNNGNLRDQNFGDACGIFGTKKSRNWKGRHTGFKTIAKLPLARRQQDETLFQIALCPVADMVEKAQKKGIEASTLCKRCPLRKQCAKRGYLSQYQDLKGVQYISIALPNILNPSLGHFIKQLQTQGDLAFDTILIDDYTLSQLTIDVPIKLRELRRAIADREKGKQTDSTLNAAYQFLDELYRAFDSDMSTPEKKKQVYRELHQQITAYDTTQQQLIREGLASVVSEEGLPLLPGEALDRGMQIKSLCRVWSVEWSLLDTVLAFFADSTEENAPIEVNPDFETAWISHYPRLDKSGINKLVLMSATADIELTQRVFPQEQIKVYEAPTVSDAQGVIRLQFDSARVTASSFFTFNADYEIDGIQEQSNAVSDLKHILRTVAAYKALTGYKAVLTSWKDLTRDGKIPDHDIVNAIYDTFDTVLHYDSVSGLNLDDHKIFIVFGMPKIKIKVIIREFLKIYATDTQPLQIPDNWQTMADSAVWRALSEEVTETENGVTLTQTRLKDPRLEQVRWNLTIAKQKQAIGRARFCRWENTLTLLQSAIYIDGFTELATPYNRNDLENATDLAVLAGDAHQKQNEDNIMETAIQRVHAGEFIRAVANDCGIPNSTLQRRCKPLPLRESSQVTHSLKYLIKGNGQNGSQATLQNQVLKLLSTDTNLGTGEIIEALDAHEVSIKKALKKLTDSGQIIKVKHGVYTLPAGMAEEIAYADVEAENATGDNVSDADNSHCENSDIPKDIREQILDVISAAGGVMPTKEIVARVEDAGEKITEILTQLVQEGLIRKPEHALYCLPTHPRATAIEVPTSKTEPPIAQAVEPPEHVSDKQVSPPAERTDRALWYAIYQIYQVLLDRRLHTRAEIAEKTDLSPDLCESALQFMYNHVMLNAGIGKDSFWMQPSYQEKASEYVLSQTEMPDLVTAHFSLSQVVSLRNEILYLKGEGRHRFMLDVQAAGKLPMHEWGQALADYDADVAKLLPILRDLEAEAANAHQKAHQSVTKQKWRQA